MASQQWLSHSKIAKRLIQKPWLQPWCNHFGLPNGNYIPVIIHSCNQFATILQPFCNHFANILQPFRLPIGNYIPIKQSLHSTISMALRKAGSFTMIELILLLAWAHRRSCLPGLMEKPSFIIIELILLWLGHTDVHVYRVDD